MTTTLAPSQPLDSLLSQLREMGSKFIQEKDYISAKLAFQKILELDKKDINSRLVYAHLIEDGTHK